MSTFYCNNCGKSFNPISKRCPHCGASLSAAVANARSNINFTWKMVCAFLIAFIVMLAVQSRTAMNEQYEKGYNKGLAEGKSSKVSSIYEYTEEDLELETKKAYNRGYAAGQAASPSVPSTKSSSINEYSGDIEAILDYIRDNPHEFYLYSERDLELAYEQGYEDGLCDR